MHLWHTSDSSFRLMKRNMSCQKLFSPVKKIVAGSRALILHPVRHNNWRIRLFFWWILCILSFVALSSITTPSFAAPVGWAAIYGEVNAETAQTIRQTSDGGYIVAGMTTSFNTGGGDAWVLKLRPDGTVEWQKTYGGSDADWAFSIQQTSDEGYVTAGWTMSFNAEDKEIRNCSVLKLRPDGDVEWRKTYGRGAERAESIQQTDDGGYIVAGWTAYFGTEDSGIWVFKLRPDGAIDPSCDFINETNVSGMDSNAIILDSSASVRDSNANPQDSSATVRDMNVSTNILCASTNVE